MVLRVSFDEKSPTTTTVDTCHLEVETTALLGTRTVTIYDNVQDAEETQKRKQSKQSRSNP